MNSNQNGCFYRNNLHSSFQSSFYNNLFTFYIHNLLRISNLRNTKFFGYLRAERGYDDVFFTLWHR